MSRVGSKIDYERAAGAAAKGTFATSRRLGNVKSSKVALPPGAHSQRNNTSNTNTHAWVSMQYATARARQITNQMKIAGDTYQHCLQMPIRKRKPPGVNE